MNPIYNHLEKHPYKISALQSFWKIIPCKPQEMEKSSYFAPIIRLKRPYKPIITEGIAGNAHSWSREPQWRYHYETVFFSSQSYSSEY